jgi:N-acetylglucosaminyl-diphospho-decaprenol L-rhamnosyltransferase
MLLYSIIVTYNGRKWIDFCLGSLRKSSILTIPLVIDNCSTDDTLSYIREQYPEAILFPQEKNLGFGQANNIGLRYALAHNADYVLLLNQDAAIAPNAIELMLSQSDGKSLLSPIHMNGDGTKVDSSFRQGSLYKCLDLIDDTYAGNIKPCYTCGEICAACWLIPRYIIEQIGGFNPLFFHYSEDNNYYQRLAYHNIKVLLVPAARMYHDRKDFGNKRVWNAQWLQNMLTLALTDINLSSKERFSNLIHVLWTCYAYRLRAHEYRVGSFIVSLFRLLRKRNYIRASRQEEMKKQSNWL